MNESQTLPSETDIDVYGSLDERCAAKHFISKSLDEAEALFRDNSLHNERTELLPIADLLSAFCDYVGRDFDRFDAAPDIYGDLSKDFSSLATSFWRLANDNTRNT